MSKRIESDKLVELTCSNYEKVDCRKIISNFQNSNFFLSNFNS